MFNLRFSFKVIETQSESCVRKKSCFEDERKVFSLKAWSFVPFTCLFFALPVQAYTQATSSTQVDDVISDPSTGVDLTVSHLLQNNGVTYAVYTDENVLVYTAAHIDDTVPGGLFGDWVVEGRHLNSQTGLVESVDLRSLVIFTNQLTLASNSVPTSGAGSVPNSPNASGVITAPNQPVADSNQTGQSWLGANGTDGHVGYMAQDGSAGPSQTITNTLNNSVTAGDKVVLGFHYPNSAIYYATSGGKGGKGTELNDGANGGAGGNLDITLNLNSQTDTVIATTGNSSNAISVESVGGGGGEAGRAKKGGYAGVGGTVSLTVNRSASAKTTVATFGNDSSAIYALSAGGSPAYPSNSGDGTNGTNGASGGEVEIINHSAGPINDSADLYTEGDRSYGIFALSKGHDGSIGADENGGIGDAISGDGGNGGGGNKVTLLNSGIVNTYGADSSALYAKSQGGQGVRGGLATGTTARSGFGGAGGSVSGKIVVDNRGTLFTSGVNARGILAQSLGGNGGEGEVPSGWAASNGGNGGAGGNAGAVGVNNSGTIITLSNASSAIHAESLGGTAGLASASGSIFGHGGNGAGAGSSAQVSVVNHGGLYTSGTGSSGIFAWSSGGGGSNGASGGALVSLGGDGGDGGNGGQVIVSNYGSVLTGGLSADAIHAQSLGGGGGSGASSGGLVTIGGDGASAANGANVFVSNLGILHTLGQSANGIYAQSLGGGGGSGSASGGLVSVGGAGSRGGNGGNVTVDNKGYINTEGDLSNAIFAESVGGGGGSGSGSAGLVAVGGGGGQGGSSGEVTVTNVGDLHTLGKQARGIFAQSIAGGGGSAGSTFGAVSVSGSGGANQSIVGGNGSGSAQKVKVDNSGTITTTLEGSDAIFAQSVGGSGGAGGSSAGLIAVGGSGGAAGDGGMVEVKNHSSLTTSGDNSDAIMAQSVGGGGGSASSTFSVSVQIGAAIGGSASGGGNGGEVSVTNSQSSGSQISTSGARSIGILAQSVGGGGGNGGMTGQFSVGVVNLSGSVGGSGGSGGSGAKVTINSNSSLSSIDTTGSDADGVIAQSIGGGGGNGGMSVSGTLGAGNIGVSVGGSGGSGGNGGEVNITALNDSITTTGQNAEGVIAQSVGGGGGNAGYAIDVSLSAAAAIGVSVGASGGAGGNGGNIVANNIGGDITTSGNNASGAIFQSVGGGGGNGGYSISVAGSVGSTPISIPIGVGGSGGVAGNGGTVGVTMTGDVNTGNATNHTGDNAVGILAQSVGGGGGNGGFNVTAGLTISGGTGGGIGVGVGGFGGGASNGGAVTADLSGAVTTQGNNAYATVVQSVGGGGGNGGFNVTGEVSISGASGGAAAIGIGGFGGDGGNSGQVTATIAGTKETHGVNSTAVTVQSMGGGGGNGGLNVAGAVSLSSAAGGDLGVGVGGFGGVGGNASSTKAIVSDLVTTHGNDSVGVLAQAVGGSGGSGGVNVTGGINVTASGIGGSIGVGVGGFGGSAGNAVDDQIPTAGVADATVYLSRSGNTRTYGDNSSAVVAQAIGGAGGTGGINVTGEANLTLSSSGGALGVGVGGFGGAGGNAGNVFTNVTADVQTGDAIPTGGVVSAASGGKDSIGILAQSVGGGGGSGNINVSGALSLSMNTAASGSIGVGGFGGQGGSSGRVDMTSTATVTTNGANAHGVVAQSVGGGGGNGGLNVSGNLNWSETSGSYSATVGVGGFGGQGGNAGDVNTTVSGSVLASGFGSTETVNVADVVVDGQSVANTSYSYDRKLNGSYGVVAQSIGGGGGNGAVNVSGTITVSQEEPQNTGALVVGIGGFGGGAGNAGKVVATVSGARTEAVGDGRAGILAQSIGGGGGNGGLNVSGGIVSDGPVMVGIGGFGQSGGTASDVTVTASSAIVTDGANAEGIRAQSIGGGGGTGGLDVVGSIATNKEVGGIPQVSFGLGGFGGAGGASGDVTVSQTLSTTTNGEWSHGILAQSIAGGGGNGGLNIAANVNTSSTSGVSKSSDLNIVAGIGGFGGVAGDQAGNVSLTNSGTVTTAGNFARGILAQSIGGGGGNGGMNVSAELANNDSPVVFGMGGNGGGGGHAGTVTVNRGTVALNASGGLTATGSAVGAITTTGGIGASAIEATSVGGGGGNGGGNLMLSMSNAPSSSNVTSSNPFPGRADSSTLDNIWNSATARNGQPKQFALQVGIGASAGTASDGNAVSVNNYSSLSTAGFQSYGALAQSIGGGGGNAGFNVGIGYSLDAPQANIALGGQTTDGGAGAQVKLAQKGNVTTQGDLSIGLLAQSIGGGGGNAGMNLVTSPRAKAGGFSMSIGRLGGTGGAGGNVDLAYNGSLSTSGEFAYGILGQSVGGGGGNSGSIGGGIESPVKDGQSYAMKIAVGLEGGTGGDGGDVTLNTVGSVDTTGWRAHAIFAQSIGGGGGNGGSILGVGMSAPTLGVNVGGTGGTGGIGGEINVTNSATVTSAGTKASGILAQSIGGGGGNGGYSNNIGIKGNGIGLRVAVGGSGGSGTDAGLVTVTNNGSITTSNVYSYGIDAVSLGGGGGNGGLSLAGILSNTSKTETGQVQVAVGGAGGTGGTGSAVTVNNNGFISTSGYASSGVRARSIGGGGGDGNIALSGSFSNGDNGGFIGDLSFGGNGGTGGTSGAVAIYNTSVPDVANSGMIQTSGANAYGIYAMSLGGGGGDGGMAISGGLTLKSKKTSSNSSFNLSIGGAGGTGDSASTVFVENKGQITTQGAGAHGIFAESIGGGGGNGNVALSGALNIKTDNTTDYGSAAFALGGSGGQGGNGATVTVDNQNVITTNGLGAHGIVAQSIGGGGGNGKLAIAANVDTSGGTAAGAIKFALSSIAIGGSGGNGGNGGDVTVTNTGNITLNGDNTYGILAQSISGGGGNAAASIGGISTLVDLAVTQLGAKSGVSGTVGNVTINSNSVNIHTNGHNSEATLNQSINGGGGNLVLDLSAENVGALASGSLQLGAVDGMNNPGGDVNGQHTGYLGTSGKNSTAFATQSIGGGGGTSKIDLAVANADALNMSMSLGASNSGESAGGNIDLQRTGLVQTAGNSSSGVSVQSVGGGGGAALYEAARPQAMASTSANQPMAMVVTAPMAAPVPEISLSLGASGGLANDGGDVNLVMDGDVTTLGERSQGLMTQSIGAGGGLSNLTGVYSASVTLGSSSGATGNGGNITITNTGAIDTAGKLSHGVLLQSIGGGGGTLLSDLNEELIALNLSNGGFGDGGDITFTQMGNVLTTGEHAYGALIQSLAGGGGAVDIEYMGSAGGSGHAGDIDVTFNGSVATAGDYSKAIFAQSAAGTGTGGVVTISAESDVYAQGYGADAVHAESSGEAGGNDITVSLNGAATIAGQGGTGVNLVGGANNSLSNHSSLASLDGLSGMAVRGGLGNDHLDNYNVIVGNIDLGSGSNGVINRANATYYSGATVNLGTGNNFANSGILSPGGNGQAQITELTGDLTQQDTAVYQVDLDFKTNQSDRINATGQVLSAGRIELNVLNPEKILPGTHQSIILYGENGLSDSGAELLASDSAIVKYNLVALDGDKQAIETNIDFGLNFSTSENSVVNNNLGAIGEYINNVQLAGGSSSSAPIIETLFNQTDQAGVAEVYEAFNPVNYNLASQSTVSIANLSVQSMMGRMQKLSSVRGAKGSLTSNLMFLDLNDIGSNLTKNLKQDNDWLNMGKTLSILNANGVEDSARKGSLWVDGGNLDAKQETIGGFDGYHLKAQNIAMGYEKWKNNDTLYGLSLGYTNSSVLINDYKGSQKIEGFNAALYGSRSLGKGYISSVLSAGTYGYDSTRVADLSGFSYIAESNHKGIGMSLFGEAGYNLVETESDIVQPYASMNFNFLREDGYSESGAGLLDLTMSEKTTRSLISEVGVRLAGRLDVAGGIIEPKMSFAWNHDFAIDNQVVRASFSGVPGGSFGVTGQETGYDRFKVGVGLNYKGENGLELGVGYQQQQKDSYSESGLKASLYYAF